MSSLALNTAQALPGVGASQQGVPDWFRQTLLAALSDPLFNVPKAFETWIVDRVAVAGLNLSVGQIVGFAQYAAQFAAVAAQENGSSATYADLATVGPALTGLPDGQYLLLYGAGVSGSVTGLVAPQVNSDVAADGDAMQCIATSSTLVPGVYGAIKTLQNSGNNSVTLKYRVGTAGTDSFAKRWLVAFKFANP